MGSCGQTSLLRRLGGQLHLGLTDWSRHSKTSVSRVLGLGTFGSLVNTHANKILAMFNSCVKTLKSI